MPKNRNPYNVKTNETVLCRIHKDLVKALDKEKHKHQKICDAKFGKDKYIVKRTFASKVLGGFLR